MRRLLLAWMVALLAAPAALGAIGVTASPTSESLSVTLDGDDQVVTFTDTLAVSNESTASWNLTAWAAPPTGTAGTLSPLTVTALPTASCGPGTCTASVPSSATTSIAWPLVLGTSSGAASKFWVSASGSTNKTQSIATVFGVQVPAKALIGSYSTTLTVAVADGP
jgi:hypothetical protein